MNQNPLSVWGWMALLAVGLAAHTDATDAATNFTKRLQAEGALLRGQVAIRNTHRDFVGSGYVRFVQKGAITWTINVPAPALYQLEFRYSDVAVSGGDRRLSITKNEGLRIEDSVAFPPTRNLDEWRTLAVFTRLEAGINTIKLQSTGQRGPNVDQLVVSLTPPDPDKFLGFPLHSSHRIFQGSDAQTTAYYKTLDPFDRKTTLEGWKQENDLSSCVAPECTHTVYFNDVDLGFGRSLFLKVLPSGDVASYLQNYPSLADAIDGRNLLATVAMEYARGVDENGQEVLSRPKFTKFYVFDAQGTRINKIDLDGRGEKFVPALCNSCHGGKPKRATNFQYLDGGETGASFIAWDLDTFKYHPALSRAMQEDEFKSLNQAVLLTRPPKATEILIDGWYGGPGLPSATFDGSFVPPGWQEDPSVEDLYRKVIAPSCRSCHNQRGSYNAAGNPVLNGPKETTLEFVSFQDFSVYKNDIERLVYEQALMPLAKRTFDRFWRSEQPKILDDVLFGGLAFQNPSFEVYPGRARFAFGELRRPGPPIARIAGSRLVAIDLPFLGYSLARVEHQKRIRLNGASSVFASEFFWRIESGPGSGIPVVTGDDKPHAFFDPNPTGSSDIRDPGGVPYRILFAVTNAFADYNEIIRGQLFSDSRLQPLTFTEDIYPLLTTDFGSLTCVHCHSDSNVVSHANSIYKLWDFPLDDDEVVDTYQAVLTRVNCNDPERSLILQKPAAELPHFGGRNPVFAGVPPQLRNPAIKDTGDQDAKARILRWIMQGAPFADGSPLRCPPLE